MRPRDRVKENPSSTLRNHVEFEGVVAGSYPLLRESVNGNAYLSFNVDISTERSMVRVPVNLWGRRAVELKDPQNPIMPGHCVLVRGRISGFVQRYGKGARWSASVHADDVQILKRGAFIGPDPEWKKKIPKDEEPEDVFLPAEAF